MAEGLSLAEVSGRRTQKQNVLSWSPFDQQEAKVKWKKKRKHNNFTDAAGVNIRKNRIKMYFVPF